MKSTIAFVALVASVSAKSAPPADGGIPPYCKNNFDGTFEISTQNYTGPSDAPQSQTLATCTTNPIISLTDGVLKDQDNRQAEVVANYQFQFDSPLQDPREYDTGFQICTDPNNKTNVTLAHGGNSTFFRCNSGSFDNLYDRSIGQQCKQIYIAILPCGSGHPSDSGSGSDSSASSVTSASPSATSAVSSVGDYTPTMQVAPITPVVAASPSTVAAPYPTGNSTAPSASGTGSPSSTAPGTSTTSPLTAPASGAAILSVGYKFGAVAVALIALVMC